jgi:hypothetical protein
MAKRLAWFLAAALVLVVALASRTSRADAIGAADGWTQVAGGWGPVMDAAEGLACAASLDATMPVTCLIADGLDGNKIPRLQRTEVAWGLASIPGGGVKSISILKRADISSTYYQVFLLTADGKIRYGSGDARNAATWYDTNAANFKTLAVHSESKNNNGQAICMKKIMWMNDYALRYAQPPAPIVLLGLSCDGNSLYWYKANGWNLWRTEGYSDMGDMLGWGATFLLKDGRLMWSDILTVKHFAPPPGVTIGAIGGRFALSRDTVNGTCTANVGCQGDATRIWYWDNVSWKLYGLPGATALPSPYSCPQASCVGPHFRQTIVDATDFGRIAGVNKAFSTGAMAYMPSFSRLYFHVY